MTLLGNSRTRLAAAVAMAAVSLVGCSAQVGNGSADSSSAAASAGPGNMEQCPGDLCVYGFNQVQVFTGPGQLGPATYTKKAESTEGGPLEQDWASTWSTASANCPTFAQAQTCFGLGNTKGAYSVNQVTYQPPEPLPQTDLVNLWANIGTPAANPCPTTNYTQCTQVASLSETNNSTGGNTAIDRVYTLTNQPLMIEVRNNLSAFQSDTISISPNQTQPCAAGFPQTQNMICDPVGTNAQSLDGGQTGYYGLYVPVSMSGLLPGGPSVSFTYTVSSDSGDNLGGATFTVNVSTTNGAVNISPSSPGGGVCTVQVPDVQYSAYCNVALQGAAGGPQTLIISIGE